MNVLKRSYLYYRLHNLNNLLARRKIKNKKWFANADVVPV